MRILIGTANADAGCQQPSSSALLGHTHCIRCNSGSAATLGVGAVNGDLASTIIAMRQAISSSSEMAVRAGSCSGRCELEGGAASSQKRGVE